MAKSLRFSDDVLLAMSAYFDLNPVRAGIVDDPADFVFRGMAKPVAAVAVPAAASALLSKKNGKFPGKVVQSSYRKLLYGVGVESGAGEGGRATRYGFAHEDTKRQSQCLSPADDSPCGRRFGAGSATSPTEQFSAESGSSIVFSNAIAMF